MIVKLFAFLIILTVLSRECASARAMGEWVGLLNNVTRCEDHPEAEAYMAVKIEKKGKFGRLLVHSEMNLPKGFGDEFQAKAVVKVLEPNGKVTDMANHIVGSSCKAANEYFGPYFRKLMNVSNVRYDEGQSYKCPASGRYVNEREFEVMTFEIKSIPKLFYGRFLVDVMLYHESGQLYFCSTMFTKSVPKKSYLQARTSKGSDISPNNTSLK